MSSFVQKAVAFLWLLPLGSSNANRPVIGPLSTTGPPSSSSSGCGEAGAPGGAAASSRGTSARRAPPPSRAAAHHSAMSMSRLSLAKAMKVRHASSAVGRSVGLNSMSLATYHWMSPCIAGGTPARSISRAASTIMSSWADASVGTSSGNGLLQKQQ